MAEIDRTLPIDKRYVLKQMEHNSPNSLVIFDNATNRPFDFRTVQNKNLLISLLNEYNEKIKFVEDIEYTMMKKRGRPRKKDK